MLKIWWDIMEGKIASSLFRMIQKKEEILLIISSDKK